MRIQTTINFEIKTKRPNTGEGGMIRGYLKLDFAHFWLGGGGGHRNPSIRNQPLGDI